MQGLKVSLFLAARSLARGNYGIAAATTLMMLLIYVSLLFLPSLIQGAVNRADSQLVNTMTSNIVLRPAGGKATIGGATSYLARIRRAPGVEHATAVYRAGMGISYGADSGSWTVDAINPSSYGKVFTTGSDIIEGHDLTAQDTNQVLLGIGIAGAGRAHVSTYRASLQSVHAGDRVSITLTNGRPVTFTVGGIYDNQFPQSDSDAYITRTEARKLLPASAGRATAIYVRTRGGVNVGREAALLASMHGDVKYDTSAEMGAVVRDQTASYRLISNILKVISLLMAAVTIFTITYIDQAGRRRQVGVERAIGIKSGPIVLSYVFKAWAYALAGIGAGFLLFQFVVIPLVNSHPFHFPDGPVTLATSWSEMTRDVVILVVVASLAALAPAMRSVRIAILEAIWGTLARAGMTTRSPALLGWPRPTRRFRAGRSARRPRPGGRRAPAGPSSPTGASAGWTAAARSSAGRRRWPESRSGRRL